MRTVHTFVSRVTAGGLPRAAKAMMRRTAGANFIAPNLFTTCPAKEAWNWRCGTGPARSRRNGEMQMRDTVYQILLGNPLAENARLWDDALRCCPFFSLVHTATDISGLVSYLAGA